MTVSGDFDLTTLVQAPLQEVFPMTHGRDFTLSSQGTVCIFLPSVSSHKRSIGKGRGMGLQVPVQLVSLGVSRAIALKMLARPANRLAAATLQSSSDRRRPGGPPAVCFSVYGNMFNNRFQC